MLREEIPSPDQRVGGGFVAGEEEGHDFVAELAVGHAGLIDFVAGGDELGKKVAMVAAFGAALADDAVNDGIELGECCAWRGGCAAWESRRADSRRFRNGG